MESNTPSVSYRCSRCDLDCELMPHYEGSAMLSWYCPCCRSRTRTSEMIEAEAEQRAAAKGITTDELFEQSKAMFRDFEKEPLSEAEVSHVRAFARARASDWTPACEHDTENPWL